MPLSTRVLEILTERRRDWERQRPLHSLGDTFIARLAESGISLDRRMKLSGHRDPKMNLAYGEVYFDSLRESIHQKFPIGNDRLTENG